MIVSTNLVSFVIPAASTVAGVSVGLIYFAALRRSVTAFTHGRGWFAPAMLTIARLVGVVIAFAMAARLGAVPLLAAFVGFLIARGISLRWRAEAH